MSGTQPVSWRERRTFPYLPEPQLTDASLTNVLDGLDKLITQAFAKRQQQMDTLAGPPPIAEKPQQVVTHVQVTAVATTLVQPQQQVAAHAPAAGPPPIAGKQR